DLRSLHRLDRRLSGGSPGPGRRSRGGPQRDRDRWLPPRPDTALADRSRRRRGSRTAAAGGGVRRRIRSPRGRGDRIPTHGGRRRALADPSPHPDLVWLAPRGAAQHLVDEVRQRVITAAAYRPFEGARRVFVIEGADAMADESQNALLKTLEEPHGFVHIILISAEPELLLETVRSRCQEVRFRPLDADTVAGELASRGLGEDDAERIAAARLASGDPRRAEFL